MQTNVAQQGVGRRAPEIVGVGNPDAMVTSSPTDQIHLRVESIKRQRTGSMPSVDAACVSCVGQIYSSNQLVFISVVTLGAVAVALIETDLHGRQWNGHGV